MAKLPGLTRQDDRPSLGGANRGRVQVRNPIGDVVLQPQARPVDTYSRPQAPASGPNGLQQLAGALAQISPALSNFIDVTEANAKKDAEDRAMRRIGGMSFAEARDAVDSGKMTEMQNPWFKAAFMRQYGERLAYERVNELTKEYETNFDKNSGDLDSFIRERTASDLQQYGENSHFTGAYSKVMDGFASRANSAQAQYQTEQVKQDTVSGVYDTFHGEATTMRADGKSPEEIVTALRGKYQGNRELLHVDFKEQDLEMVRLAEAFAAKGDTAMVDAILNSERKGADGTVLGTLASNREFQADAVRIQNAAKRQNQEQAEESTRDLRMEFWDQARQGQLDREKLLTWHRSHEGAFTEAQVLSLINQNDTFNEAQAKELAKAEHKLYLEKTAAQAEEDLTSRNLEAAKTGMLPYIEEATVPTKTGETKTVSVDDQKKAVAKRIVDQTDWLVEKKKATPDQAFGMQVESFSVGNLTNPKWEHVLGAGPKAAAQFTLSGGEVPPALQDSVDLYMKLHAANPKLLDTHIKDTADRDFYEAYRVATQYGQLDPTQAMQAAMMQTSDPSKFQGAGTQQRFDQIDQRVQSITYGGIAGWFSSAPKNQGYVANEIGRLGKFYAQNGMGVDAALDEAKKRFEATHTEIAGNFVYTAGKDIPSNFGEMAKHAIDKYVEDFGETEGVDADDLTIRPATNGNGWLIVHQTGQYPVENSARANLSLRSLYQMEQERQEKTKQDVIDGQSANQDRLNKVRQARDAYFERLKSGDYPYP
ncbi:hypothetical protein [Shinella zoogloeoides]|uniref:hypothetical protein n=1 Tax=Shinella zoogloeoides TaxID=352475 RepID=UPI0028B1AEA1|nr:hypothetical protein [Shinella zoogloeoides]